MTDLPPQQPPMGYGQTGGAMKPHRGTAVLVLGILGLVICVICGIVAWVMGNADLRDMESGRMDPSGLGMTKAGKICGMVSVILNIIGIGIFLLMTMCTVAAGVSGMPATPGG